MEHEQRTVLRLAAKVLYVYTGRCGGCQQPFDYTVESADTDMLSCYCGSVYSCRDRQLVVAPLTEEEIFNGIAGQLDRRVNAACPGHDCRYFGYRRDWRCPLCGSAAWQSGGGRLTLREYCVRRPNTMILYRDGSLRELRRELDDTIL